jgi:hypothetical protein
LPVADCELKNVNDSEGIGNWILQRDLWLAGYELFWHVNEANEPGGYGIEGNVSKHEFQSKLN